MARKLFHVISQNTVTVDVLQQDRERLMQEVADRNGRVVPEFSNPQTRVHLRFVRSMAGRGL
jgi:hypothetical protein